MTKIFRNMSTPECRVFWAKAEQGAADVASWPNWKRAGINVAYMRDELRATPELSPSPESSTPRSR